MTRTGPWWTRHGWPAIAAAVLVAYWPLSTFSFTLSAHDTLNCWLPWRHFIAEALQDGSFPAWNPYQQMGYPIHADLQGPAWYVEALALGGTIGHGVHVLQALFLLYLIIGGCGFRRFVLHLHGDPAGALTGGIAYALGGFFTAHAMHFFSVISGAWLPWLLLAWWRTVEAPNLRHALRTAVFLFLLLTGGNPTFTIIAAYLMAAMLMMRAIQQRRSRTAIRTLAAASLTTAAAAVVLSCGVLYSAWEVAPFLDRAGGIPHDKAAVHPFSVQAFVSFLFPYASSAEPDRLGIDPSMSNAWIGTLMLALALLSLLRRRSALENLLLVFGGLCLLLSLGDAIPLYGWAHAFLPGIDLFRFPSYFTWFTGFALLVAASGSLSRIAQIVKDRPRAAMIAFGAFAGAMVLLFAIGAMRALDQPLAVAGHHEDLFARMNAPGRAERIVLQGLVVIPSFFLFLFFLHRGRMRWLRGIIVIEMIAGAWLCQWTTAIAHIRPGELQARIDAQPHGPVVPELHPMGLDRDGGIAVRPLWLNTQDFTGRPTHDGFNSFWLSTMNELEAGHAALLEAMKRQPLVYLADRVVAAGAYDPTRVDPSRDSGLVVIGDEAMRGVPMRRSPADRIELTEFHHRGLTARVKAAFPSFMLVQQAWYPGWAVRVNGSPAEVVRANVAAFGAWVPAGESTVEVAFEKPLLGRLLLISYGCFFAVLLFLVRGGGHPVRDLAGLIALALMLGWSLFGHRSKRERMKEQLERISSGSTLNGTTMVVNTDRPREVLDRIGGADLRILRTDQPDAIDRVASVLNEIHEEHLVWTDAGLPLPAGARAMVLDRFPSADAIHRSSDVQAVRLSREGGGPSWKVIHEAPDTTFILCGAGTPYTPAMRRSAAELMDHDHAWLVADAEVRGVGSARAYVVIERRKNDRLTDFEAVPVEGEAGGWRPVYAAQPLWLLRDADEEVGVYVWNDGADTLQVRKFRVRIMDRDLSRW